jgi:hypothetical protein
MKKIIYILIAFSIISYGCNDEFNLEDQDLNVKFLSGKYVAFNAPGANTTIEDVTANEGTVVELNVEIPTGTLSNVNVDFIFGGTAVYGTDYNVSGGSSAGGSITIVPLPGDDQTDVIDNEDIVINLLTDGVTDGNKTLTVTLTSASNNEGTILVGRGGEDILKSTTINITDVD